MSQTEVADLLAAAEELALRAGRIHRELFRTLDPHAVSLKGRRNPVTEADLRAEALLVEEIRRRYPRHSIVAEEGPGHQGDAEYRWHLDPLDGTVNFSHGLPLFAVSIAVARGPQLLAAALYAPILNELYLASHQGGATRNGRPLRVSRCNGLQEALMATGFCYERNEVADNNVDQFADLVLRCRDLRRLGSAGLDLALVAAGHYDAYWELHLSSWDMAAGLLLVTEAGGKVTDLSGGDQMLERGEVVASNGTALHQELRQALCSADSR
jgi:myo-inositol-1(or 4)-monophosphatase